MGCIHAFVGEAAAIRILVNNQSMWLPPNHLKERLCLCGQRVLRVVTFDGEKASRGLLRYTLLVWWRVSVHDVTMCACLWSKCVYAPVSAPECMFECVYVCA